MACLLRRCIAEHNRTKGTCVRGNLANHGQMPWRHVKRWNTLQVISAVEDFEYNGVYLGGRAVEDGIASNIGVLDCAHRILKLRRSDTAVR